MERIEGLDDSQPGIGLAISSGGARGFATVGVLKVLEREHIKINFIAGVSMGGIIGGLYACGYSPEEIENLAHNVNWNELFSPSPIRSTLLTTQKGQSEKSLLKIRFQDWRPVVPRGITSAQNIIFLLERLTSRAGIRSSISFDYLEPPLRIICTDLGSGEKVIISSGNLGEAMRATMAVPVAFTPVEIGERVLVDGGLVDPVPVDVVRDAIGYPVVAINTAADLLPLSEINDAISIADQTTTIMSMDKKEAALAQADCSIDPYLYGRPSGDFSNIDSIVQAGEDAAIKALPQIRELIGNKRRQSEDSTCYKVGDPQVTNLNFMPKTFFLSTFQQSADMTCAMIENNLRRAFASGYLADCWAELHPDSGGYTLEYHLSDNPRVKSIVIAGATLIPQDQLERLIKTDPGSVYNTRQTEEDRRSIERAYIDLGFTLTRVTTNFNRESGQLTLAVDEGRVNQVKIIGLQRTRNWLIARHIPFKKGEIFRQRQAERAIEDIYSTDLFETAKFLAVPDSQGVTLVIKVTERAYSFLRFGAAYDSEYGSRAFLDIVDDNFLGAGQEIYFSGKMGEKKRGASLNFQADRIFSSLYTYQLVFDYREFKRNYYIDHQYRGYNRQFSHGGEFSLGRQFPRLGMIMAVAQLRHIRWEQPGKPGLQQFDKLSLGFQSVVDTRDAVNFPERGKYHLFNLEFASNLNDQKTAYTRFYTQLEAYYPFSKKLNINPSLALGASSDFMPYFDAFSFGGLHSFLGLHEDELLGDKILQGSLEMRYRLWERLYLMGAYNIGNIWNRLESIRFSELRHAGGLGVGIKTPVGPLEGWYGRTNAGKDAFYLKAGYDW